MVVFLLIVIIIILAPGLIGTLLGGAIGVSAGLLPLVFITLGVLCVGALLGKGLGEPSENKIHEQAKQAIDDKYTAFYAQ